MTEPRFITDTDEPVREEDLPPLPPPDPTLAALARSYEPKVMAHALVVSEYEGDKAALDKFGITQAELNNARVCFYKAPRENRPLVNAVRQVREAMAVSLNDKLMGAQVAMADFLTRAAREADASDPAAIEKITKGFEAVSEVLLTSRMVDVRLNGSAPRKAITAGPDSEDD